MKFLPLILALLAAVALSGCATTSQGPERVSGSDDPLRATAEQVVGTVTYVDPAGGIVLIEMRSPSIRLVPELVTQNEALIETGRIEPTRFQRGRTLGTRILSGIPNVGDEVVIP